MFKKIFLTGATGFIGSNLLKALVEQGYVVHALIRKDSSKENSFHYVQGDLFDLDVLDKEIAACDAVIHCAAFVSFKESDARELYHVNIRGTEHIANACLKHRKRLVYVSTASTIGAPTKKPRIMDETEPFIFKGTTSYAHSKFLGEQCVHNCVKKGLNAVIVNPSSVYGFGDKKGAGPSLYPLLEKYPIFIAPPGGCSVIAVHDVVSGIIAALEKGKTGERYILTSENVRYKEIFAISLRLIKGWNVPLLTLPQATSHAGNMLLEKVKLTSTIVTPTVFSFLFNYRYLSNAKAKQELPWSPIISLQQAIEESYAYYQNLKEELPHAR